MYALLQQIMAVYHALDEHGFCFTFVWCPSDVVTEGGEEVNFGDSKVIFVVCDISLTVVIFYQELSFQDVYKRQVYGGIKPKIGRD